MTWLPSSTHCNRYLAAMHVLLMTANKSLAQALVLLLHFADQGRMGARLPVRSC